MLMSMSTSKSMSMFTFMFMPMSMFMSGSSFMFMCEFFMLFARDIFQDNHDIKDMDRGTNTGMANLNGQCTQNYKNFESLQILKMKNKQYPSK
jgi:hypothetical protein